MNQRDIFTAAIQITDPVARSAYLEQACGSDPSLRKRVETLLRVHDSVGDFLDRPVVEQLAHDRSTPAEDVSHTPVSVQAVKETEPLEAEDEEDEELSFLQPSERPGSLGRLGHYEVLEVLGRGGFATVVRAFDEVLQRVVAIKVQSAQLAVTSPARKRFLREARATAAVRDDHVVQIYAVEEKPRPYLVMEYIAGQTLQQKLDATGPLEAPEMVRLATQIARGLAAAHGKNLIHRDIKPSNILLEQGGETKAKLTDFGLARTVDDASLTQSGVIAGTPLYMAPEQAQGECIDHRTDLFSLGSVFYVMLTGRPPFRAPTTLAVLKRVCEDSPRPIHEIIPEAPAWLCDLIGTLHSKKPNKRFQTAKEVADLLTQTPLEFNPRRRRFLAARPRRWKWLAAVALLLAVALTLGLTGKRQANLADAIHGRSNGEESPVPSDDPTPLGAPTAKLKKALIGHGQGLRSVAYSPDGRLLASGDAIGELRVWNMPEGTPRYLLPAHGLEFDSPHILEDGKLVGRYVQLERGQKLHGLTFSPDCKFLLTACAHSNGDIHIWDAETGKSEGALKGHTSGVYEVSFGPDGKTLVSGGWDGTIRVWDFAARREVLAVPSPDGEWIRSVVVSASGKIAVGGGEQGKVFLFEPDGKLVRTLDTSAGPLCFSPDGRLLAGTTWREGRVTVWDINSEKMIASWQAHEGMANGVAFWGDGRILATAGGDDVVRLWDIATQRQLAELRHEGHAYQLAFSPDGAILATTAMDDGLVKLWDVSFLRSLKLPDRND